MDEEQQIAEREAFMRQVREVCANPAGLVLIRWIIDCCHPNSSSFSTDIAVMALREGERNISLRIRALLDEADPSIYRRLIDADQETKRGRITE